MRLPVEKIKQAILNPDQDIREAAAQYFYRSFSPDPAIMPLAIQAIEQYGPAAFHLGYYLDRFVQTPESVAWLIREIERVDLGAGEESDNWFENLIDALRHANVAAIVPYESAIQAMRQLDDESKAIISDRIVVSSFTLEALWRELKEFCEEADQEDGSTDEDYEYACSVCDALTTFPGPCAAQVLDILKIAEADSGWLEIMAVRMAGPLRLTEAIPYLVDLLRDPNQWACEYARDALVKIGTDSLIEEMATQYTSGDTGLRMETAFLLANVPSDFSVQTSLKLLAVEVDEELRGCLVEAAIRNFSSEGIDVGREYVLATPKSPEVLEIRGELPVAARLMEVQFPEIEAWTEDAKHDRDFRREWYRDRPLSMSNDIGDFDDDEGWIDDEFDADDEDDFHDVPPDTIVRHETKIGRNDPCPCGSGKKFKKCCYGKPVIR